MGYSDRIAAAIALVRAGAVTGPRYIVKSGDKKYDVLADDDGFSCTCPWGENTEHGFANLCKHSLAVSAVADIPVPVPEEDL